MIKPSEIDIKASRLNSFRLTEIEKRFDLAIHNADISGKGPAVVPASRDGSTNAEIEHVADKYRAAGWKVATGPSVIIDHPSNAWSGS